MKLNLRVLKIEKNQTIQESAVLGWLKVMRKLISKLSFELANF